MDPEEKRRKRAEKYAIRLEIIRREKEKGGKELARGI
jgi:hypothetical protein